jgi:hypothetical protein
MRFTSLASVACLVACLGLGACSAPATSETEPVTAAPAALAGKDAAPHATGSFVAPGNDGASPFSPPANPIVAVVANGATLELTAKNGETGTIALEGMTATGAFRDAWGLEQIWLAPFSSGHANAPVSTLELAGGAGLNQAITLHGAGASTMNGSFAFEAPFDGGPTYVVAVEASGSTITFRDAFGATGTITLSADSAGAN